VKPATCNSKLFWNSLINDVVLVQIGCLNLSKMDVPIVRETFYIFLQITNNLELINVTLNVISALIYVSIVHSII